LAQPPLSQQIRKLEELLGYSLFTRTSRSVSLTHAGEALLQRARRTLRNVQRDIDETRSIAHGDVGSLHVGFVGSAMLTMLPGIFRSYREAYPRVKLHLHESFTALVIEGLENGTLDAGILRDGDPVEGLHVTTILSEPFVAVLPATHPSAKQKSISIAVLRDEPFVYYPRSAGARAYEKALTLCEEHGFQPQIVQEASHWLSILRLIGAGLGVSIAPACVRRIASEEVVCLPLRGARAVSNIELAWLAGDARPIVERFRQIAESTRTVQ
jgi:DNA-binding transcriptional LysR family regulator